MSRILFLYPKKTMIANTLIEGLKVAGFEVRQAMTNVTDISKNAGVGEQIPEIWILYLQGTDMKLTDVLSYIRDQISEFNIRLFVIGLEEEIRENLKGFPQSEIKGIFQRPFRKEEVIEKLMMEEMKVKRIRESRRILIVDDDATILRAMKDMMASKYRVYTANSGMNAIQVLATMEVDLIILDYEMPVIKGPQILEMLRSEPHTKDIPVMFLTGKSDRDSIIQVMSLHPANYLLKSLPQSEILRQIDEFFEKEEK